MARDPIGHFVTYHDYAMKSEECDRLRARVAELEAALAKREAVLPDVLFDGHRVWKRANESIPLIADEVSAVLDAVVELAREDTAAILAATKAQEGKP